MATLVLGTVGRAIGGPLGGALGALLGNRIDRAVLGGTREGPRLTELAVQTSSYGTAIPLVFGTMRVAARGGRRRRRTAIRRRSRWRCRDGGLHGWRGSGRTGGWFAGSRAT